MTEWVFRKDLLKSHKIMVWIMDDNRDWPYGLFKDCEKEEYYVLRHCRLAEISSHLIGPYPTYEAAAMAGEMLNVAS